MLKKTLKEDVSKDMISIGKKKNINLNFRNCFMEEVKNVGGREHGTKEQWEFIQK